MTFGPRPPVERPAAGTHLRRVRVVARQRPNQEADHDGLANRERACGQNPIALTVGRAAQLDALLLGNLGGARLALREDRRPAAARRGGAGQSGRTYVGQGNPFLSTPSKDEHSPRAPEPPAAPSARAASALPAAHIHRSPASPRAHRQDRSVLLLRRGCRSELPRGMVEHPAAVTVELFGVWRWTPGWAFVRPRCPFRPPGRPSGACGA